MLIRDTNTRLFNDKNSMTADPNDSNVVYAVWDRLNTSFGFAINPEHAVGLGFKGPVLSRGQPMAAAPGSRRR